MTHAHRRRLWRRMLTVLSMLSVLALVAAACGGDSTDDGAGTADGDTSGSITEDTTEPEADAFDPDGILRTTGSITPTGSAIIQYDPIQLISPADSPGNARIHSLIYGTFLRALADKTYEPDLAESVEVVDPQTIVIHIRDGVEFSDGTPFDADAVKAGLERNMAAAPDNPGAFSVDFLFLESVTVDDPLTVTLGLSEPAAGSFYPLLARGETMIVSPTAVADGVDLQTDPVGAGPFLLDQVNVERNITLVKSPTYWDAENVRVAGVEIIHSASPDATTNAILSGAVDVVDVTTPQLIAALEGSDLEVTTRVSDSNLFWGQLCKSEPPLDDVRVRQALNFALDRDQLNEVLFAGESQPMWGFNVAESAYHDPALDGYYERDVARAQELLAEAGYPDGFDLVIAVPSAGGDAVTATEIAQQNFAEIGVNVVIEPSADLVTEFFLENRYPAMFFNLQRTGLDRVTRTLVPGSIGNVCTWDDPDLNALVDEIRGLDPESDEAIEAWKELDAHALETAANIFGVFGTSGNVVDAETVGGVRLVTNFQGQTYVDMAHAFVKQ